MRTLLSLSTYSLEVVNEHIIIAIVYPSLEVINEHIVEIHHIHVWAHYDDVTGVFEL